MWDNLLSRCLQIVFIVVLLTTLGYFADLPVYQIMEPNRTELKLVIRHSGIVLGECELLSASDLQKKAPNMRQAMSCPREKSPLEVELLIDGDLVYQNQVKPSGIHSDGVLALYKRFEVETGIAQIELRVRDQIGNEAYSHQQTQSIELSEASILIVEFTDVGIRFTQPGLTAS